MSSHVFLSPSRPHQNLCTTNNELCFQEGANSAFQEAVGDAVMYGVMAPQHLQRLGFINDTSQGNFIQFKPYQYTLVAFLLDIPLCKYLILCICMHATCQPLSMQ